MKTPFSWFVAIIAHEQVMMGLKVPDMLEAIPRARVLAMKQQARLLYNHYFNSVQSIVLSSLMVALTFNHVRSLVALRRSWSNASLWNWTAPPRAIGTALFPHRRSPLLPFSC